MQIKETSNEGLKRTLQVVVGADELNERFNTRLSEMRGRVHLKGFRKGHVPVAHLKKIYGKSVMAEVVEQAVRESSSKAIQDRNERPALQPDIALPEDESEIEKIISGEADLSYSMSFEILPEIELADFSKLKLERLSADADNEAIDDALGELLKRGTTFETEEGREAQEGDQVTIDFVGSIDGEEFEGGKGEDGKAVIGQGGFIPGFEEGLKGAKAGEDRVIDADFPDDYSVADLAGKKAQFAIKIKEVGAPKIPELNDEFAKTLGLDSLEKLRDVVKAQLQQEHDQAARMKLKRELLDALAEAHDFEVPPSLAEKEFEAIWEQREKEMAQAGKTLEDEGKSEEELRTNYREIADRRVRLGLVLREIGDKNEISVSQDELRQALMERARAYPGQEKIVYEYYQKTPGALEELRAPMFEEKVIDFVLELAKPTEKKVSKEELYKLVEEATESEDL